MDPTSPTLISPQNLYPHSPSMDEVSALTRGETSVSEEAGTLGRCVVGRSPHLGAGRSSCSLLIPTSRHREGLGSYPPNCPSKQSTQPLAPREHQSGPPPSEPSVPPFALSLPKAKGKGNRALGALGRGCNWVAR